MGNINYLSGLRENIVWHYVWPCALCPLLKTVSADCPSQTAQIAESQIKEIKASSPQSEVHLVPPPLLSLHLTNPLIYTPLAELSVLFSKSHTLSSNPPPPLSQKHDPYFSSSPLSSYLPYLPSISSHHCCLWMIMHSLPAITWKVTASFSDRKSRMHLTPKKRITIFNAD